MSINRDKSTINTLSKENVVENLTNNIRADGRKINEFRELIVETNIIEKAEGSAKVKLGNTEVIAGVKIQVGSPFANSPNQGILIVSAEILPISMPNVELGPPSENVIELSRVVDRGIRESKMINLDDLVLLEGKSVYTVFVDVSIINADGNLFDAVSYAALVALSLTKFNKYKIDKEDNVVQTNVVTDLSVKFTPISITHIKIDDHILADPTAREESLMNSRITLTADGDGNICAGQKGLAGPFSPEEIISCSKQVFLLSEKINKILKKAIINGKKKI